MMSLLRDNQHRVAKCLVDREHHRFQSDFDNSLVVKLFAFQFVNSYASLLYIGFIQRVRSPPA